MNAPVVLDTNALICLFRGESEDVKRAVMGASRIVIPLTVFGEFIAETMEVGGRLVSMDGHFSNIPMLNWTKCE